MSKSGRLRLGDLKHIYRLIGECRDLGADPDVWRVHLLEQLCRMLDMQVGIAGETPWRSSFCCDELEGVFDVGRSGPKRQSRFRQNVAEGTIFSDSVLVTMSRLSPGRFVARTQKELVSDAEWYRSFHFNEYRREFGLDAGLLSLQRLDIDGRPTLHGICLHRKRGAKPCTSRERRILRWTHHELGPFVGRQLAVPGEPSVAALSPRLRQTLRYLLHGDSEKQVANRLGVSRGTVHKYVTRLYRHFDVQSRGELLSHWVRFDGRPDKLLTKVQSFDRA